MPRLSKAQLAEKILEVLGSSVTGQGDLAAEPFLLDVDGVVPLAIFAFNVTDPPGGRDASELKIQLIGPGHKRGERGSFTAPSGRWPILLGYSTGYDVFVLWDAHKHVDFAWSKNCQVRMKALTTAQTEGRGFQTRTLAGGVSETILTARPDHLLEVLRRRVTDP
ncbi:MAG: hypothetical protein ACLP50_19545 [Solirubrobacteraceae bacterium]